MSNILMLAVSLRHTLTDMCQIWSHLGNKTPGLSA